MKARTAEDALKDVVTVIRLVPLARSGRPGVESAIVASFGSACMRTEGDAIFLVVRDESTLERLKVGDIVHWVAEPFGVVWLAEREAGDACVAWAGTPEAGGGEEAADEVAFPRGSAWIGALPAIDPALLPEE